MIFTLLSYPFLLGSTWNLIFTEHLKLCFNWPDYFGSSGIRHRKNKIITLLNCFLRTAQRDDKKEKFIRARNTWMLPGQTSILFFRTLNGRRGRVNPWSACLMLLWERGFGILSFYLCLAVFSFLMDLFHLRVNAPLIVRQIFFRIPNLVRARRMSLYLMSLLTVAVFHPAWFGRWQGWRQIQEQVR